MPSLALSLEQYLTPSLSSRRSSPCAAPCRYSRRPLPRSVFRANPQVVSLAIPRRLSRSSVSSLSTRPSTHAVPCAVPRAVSCAVPLLAPILSSRCPLSLLAPSLASLRLLRRPSSSFSRRPAPHAIPRLAPSLTRPPWLAFLPCPLSPVRPACLSCPLHLPRLSHPTVTSSLSALSAPTDTPSLSAPSSLTGMPSLSAPCVALFTSAPSP